MYRGLQLRGDEAPRRPGEGSCARAMTYVPRAQDCVGHGSRRLMISNERIRVSTHRERGAIVGNPGRAGGDRLVLTRRTDILGRIMCTTVAVHHADGRSGHRHFLVARFDPDFPRFPARNPAAPVRPASPPSPQGGRGPRDEPIFPHITLAHSSAKVVMPRRRRGWAPGLFFSATLVDQYLHLVCSNPPRGWLHLASQRSRCSRCGAALRCSRPSRWTRLCETVLY